MKEERLNARSNEGLDGTHREERNYSGNDADWQYGTVVNGLAGLASSLVLPASMSVRNELQKEEK